MATSTKVKATVQTVTVTTTVESPFTIKDLKQFVKDATDMPGSTPVIFKVAEQVYQPTQLVAVWEVVIPPDVAAQLPS